MKTSKITRFLLAAIITTCWLSVDAQTIELVADINKVPVNSEIEPGVTYAGKYYYSAKKAHGSAYLQVYDGTNSPTLAPGVTGASSEAGRNPKDLIIFKGKLYFNGYQSWKGTELMSYDFSTAPKMVADIYSTGQASSNPLGFTVFNNKLYFAASEAATGRELYEYDGVNAPKVIDMIPGTGSLNPEELTVYDNKLYFRGTDENFDVELYEYDGVNAPRKYNIQPKAIGNSSTISGKPEYLTVFNGI